MKMKTSKFLAMGMLATVFLSSCSNDEEAVRPGAPDAIQVSAGISLPTRAVIDAGHTGELNISFARLDAPDSGSDWTAINAVRAGGAGHTGVTFGSKQTYSDANGESVLIGYHPQSALATDSDPATVIYTITGDEDIMATETQTGATDNPFIPFTFRHLLTQVQFRCVGSAEAIAKWTAVSSIKVKNVATALTLSLDKTDGATLAAGNADQELDVINCPTAVTLPAAPDPVTGYLMIYPVQDMGTASAAIELEVKATFSTVEKTVDVSIDNITGGVKAGESHLITLTFTDDGEISVEAGIAAWTPGNGGSSEIIPQ